MTQIWAHRGARLVAPENTLAAFSEAAVQGADGVELDVHLTADGLLVVHHDPVLPLPDGSRLPISVLTRDEVALVRVGDGSLGRQRVPFLAEALDLLAPTGLAVNVEIKVGAGAPYRGIASAVAAAVRSARMVDRVVVSSFDHIGLLEVRAEDPALSLAPLYEDGLARPWDYVLMLGLDAAHPQVDTLGRPGTLESFRAAGVAVRPWTANDPEQWRMLIEAQVDAIIVDDPAAAVAFRDSVSGAETSVSERSAVGLR